MTTTRQASPVDDQTAQRPDAPGETLPGIVAIAWPTGRPIHPYTAAELAEGVDVYTRAMKARAADATGGGHRDED
jgi:hypothetical protein